MIPSFDAWLGIKCRHDRDARRWTCTCPGCERYRELGFLTLAPADPEQRLLDTYAEMPEPERSRSIAFVKAHQVPR